MNPSPFRLYLSGKEIESRPVDAALRSVLEHLSDSPDAFFILDYAGGFFQGHRLEENLYRLEYAVMDEETQQNHQHVCREPVSGIRFCEMFADLMTGGTAWRDAVEWDELDLSVDEDQEVFLGSFEPREIHPLLEALHAEGVEVRMEQSVRGYDLVVTAGALEAANAVVRKTLRLEV